MLPSSGENTKDTAKLRAHAKVIMDLFIYLLTT